MPIPIEKSSTRSRSMAIEPPASTCCSSWSRGLQQFRFDRHQLSDVFWVPFRSLFIFLNLLTPDVDLYPDRG